MKRKALILGGGVVGVAAFIALVRRGAADVIEIVNPGPLGLGKAFATTESALLTNTSVDALSIIADDKDDFLHYLHNRGVLAIMTSFIDQAKLSIRAGSSKHVERADKGWIVEWPDGHTQTFDAVVCATGFYPPRFHATRDALSIVMVAPVNDDHSLNAPRVTADLRVTLEGADAPENIWLVGVSSYLRSALVSIIYQGAQQADAIASSLARAK